MYPLQFGYASIALVASVHYVCAVYPRRSLLLPVSRERFAASRCQTRLQAARYVGVTDHHTPEQTGTHGTNLPPTSCAGRTVFRPKARPWEACYPSKVVSISRSPWSFSARTEGARSASPAKVPGAKPLNYSSVALAPYQLSLVLKRAATASYRCEFLFLPSAPDNSTVNTVSWEVGTFQTALLELNAPEMFLYKPSNSFPPVLTSNSVVSDIFASVDAVLTHQPWGALPLFADEAVGDPASALVTGTSAFTHLTLRFAPCFRCWYCPSRSKLDCHAWEAALEVCECRTWAA